jgi:iron complex transport system ATP-binding protein
VIETRDLVLGYGAGVVLRDVTMRVATGELLAIIGPNGAGKSTLLRALAGLHGAAAGSVDVDGLPIAQMSGRERAKRVALVEADAAPVEHVTVREAVAQGRLPHRPWWRWGERGEDETVVEASIERARLAEFHDRPIETLSTGERQRVWIALALAQEAPTLLFDEPTSHLDLRHAMNVLSLLRGLARSGSSIAVVFHDINLAAVYGDRIALLGGSTLRAYGPPESVVREDVLSETYGVPIVVRYEEGMPFAFVRPPRETMC